MSDSTPCPFSVGDRIHQVHAARWETDYADSHFNVPVEKLIWELDPSQPDATVTALTKRGFTYEYDYPIPFGRVAWGEQQFGGECFEGGFHMWRKVE